jgi:5-(carboxyamino)imidazole ribonucleotide synthase
MTPEPQPYLSPGSTIGILGGGQLGRMLALAAARLGMKTHIYCPDPQSPAFEVTPLRTMSAYGDEAALKSFVSSVDVVTYEFENVPAAAVSGLAGMGLDVFPEPLALRIAQDRFDEKTFLNAHGAPTVAFRGADSAEAAVAAAEALGAPALMKSRREGYDGKGQRWIARAAEAGEAFAALGGVPVILEAAADFVRELSVVAARGRDGTVAAYPLGENQHENGVLRRTLAPARVALDLADRAERIAGRILAGLDYVGVIGVELFEMRDGRLLVNEIAPRVHNTGHWTQDGCEVDQFEQHVRAIAGWPLGPTRAIARVEMLNLLGDEAAAWLRYAQEPESRLHLYGKREAKPGRKMGHVNRVTPLDGAGR